MSLADPDLANAATLGAGWHTIGIGGPHMVRKLTLILAALLMPALAIADDDEDQAELLKVKAPAAKPATRPAGPRAQAKVDADVQAILDKVNEAYTKLNSLELGGTISLNVEDGGAKRKHEAQFSSSF